MQRRVWFPAAWALVAAAALSTVAGFPQVAEPGRCLSPAAGGAAAASCQEDEVERLEEQLAESQRHELLQVALSRRQPQSPEEVDEGAPTRKYGGEVPMKGISYGPAPLQQPDVLLSSDLFSEGAAALWSDEGRGDLRIMSAMGANTVRLHGNDPRSSKKAFLDDAQEHGLGVILGMNDYPYSESQDRRCLGLQDCFDVAKSSYRMSLENGLLLSGGRAYHPALKAFILLNEPELQMPEDSWCRAILSALDGVLEAEKEVGVAENLIAFSVSFSFSSSKERAPGLGQMEDLHNCMRDPVAAPAEYTPKNDLLAAYQSRFVNSLNVASPGESLRELFLVPYKSSSFWTKGLKVPVMLGEYHSPHIAVGQDLKSILDMSGSAEFPYFLGLSFFEFTVRSHGDRAGMGFGMFGYGPCNVAELYLPEASLTAWNLVPRMDKTGASMPEAVASAYRGALPSLSCEAAMLIEEGGDEKEELAASGEADLEEDLEANHTGMAGDAGVGFCNGRSVGWYCNQRSYVNCCRSGWGISSCSTRANYQDCIGGPGYHWYRPDPFHPYHRGNNPYWGYPQGGGRSSFCSSRSAGWFCQGYHNVQCCSRSFMMQECSRSAWSRSCGWGGWR